MDRIRQFADSTSFHGIKEFLRIKSYPILILWTFIITACISTMLFEMLMISFQYRTHPTATQVNSVAYESYPYPGVLFCPSNWINETKVAELNMSKPLLVYALSLLPDLVLNGRKGDFATSTEELIRFDRELRSFLRNINLTSYLDFYKLIADDPRLVGRCDKCDYVVKQVVAFGVCFRIRLSRTSAPLYIQMAPSFGYIYPNMNWDPNKYSDLIPPYSGSYAADTVYVSYRASMDSILYDPILLDRNFSYVIQMKPSLYQRMNKPNRPCFPHKDVWVKNYSELMCHAKCVEMRSKICRGCSYLTYESEILDNETDINNSYLPCTYTDLFRGKINDNCLHGKRDYDFCVKQCKPLCYEWAYETTVFPVRTRKLYSKYEEADITLVFSYHVRYGETVIKEVPTYTWSTFLSNVGGQMVLWIGASVLSLLQFCHYLVLLIFERLRGMKKGEVRTSRRESVQREGRDVKNNLNILETQEHYLSKRRSGVVNTSATNSNGTTICHL